MIVFTTEGRGGATLVHLHGDLTEADGPGDLVVHLDQVGQGRPLFVDLTDVVPIDGPGVAELVLRLQSATRPNSTVLVHEDLAARRLLRSMSHRLPVVPDAGLAIGGWFPVALDPQLADTKVS